MDNGLSSLIKNFLDKSANLIMGNAMIIALLNLVRFSQIKAWILKNVLHAEDAKEEADVPKTFFTFLYLFLPSRVRFGIVAVQPEDSRIKRLISFIKQALRLILDVLVKNQVMSLVFRVANTILGFLAAKMVSGVMLENLTKNQLAQNNAAIIAVLPIAPYLSIMRTVIYASFVIYTTLAAIGDVYNKKAKDGVINVEKGIDGNKNVINKFLTIKTIMIFSACSEFFHIFGKDVIGRTLYAFFNIEELANLSVIENSLRVLAGLAPKELVFGLMALSGIFLPNGYKKLPLVAMMMIAGLSLAGLTLPWAISSAILSALVGEALANTFFYITLGVAISLACVGVKNIVIPVIADPLAYQVEQFLEAKSSTDLSEERDADDVVLSPQPSFLTQFKKFCTGVTNIVMGGSQTLQNRAPRAALVM